MKVGNYWKNFSIESSNVFYLIATVDVFLEIFGILTNLSVFYYLIK